MTSQHENIAIAIFRDTHDQVVNNRAWGAMFSAGIPTALREKVMACRQPILLHLNSLRVVVEPLGDGQIMATCIDETAEQRERLDTARTIEIKERMLAAMTHDVRGTLSTILLWERILRDRFDDPDVRNRALEAIRRSATVQSETVLELEHVANLVGNVEYERVHVDALLAGAVDLVTPTATARSVQLRCDYRPALGHVWAHHVRLHRAFEILVDARVRATTSGETCTIAARRKNDTVMIVIGDVEREPAIDEPVTMLDLSLVIVDEVLVLHGGALDATRPAQGGTPTFWIRLPLAHS